MPGENEEAVVLSHAENEAEVTATEKAASEASTEKSGDDAETKRRNYENMHRRLQQKSWRQIVESEYTPDAVLNVVNRAARDEGIDVESDENKKQLRVIARSVMEAGKMHSNIKQSSKSRDASSKLSQTLESLGYQPASPEGKSVGQYLFEKIGVSDPDVFENRELVEKEIEGFFSRAKGGKVDPVGSAVLKKVGTPSGSSESRAPSVEATKTKEMETFAAERGVGKAKAEKLKELEKKLPASMRRK